MYGGCVLSPHGLLSKIISEVKVSFVSTSYASLLLRACIDPDPILIQQIY